jgi:phosphoenolpyruvate synthase/pyruvate phosphate dikinase
MINVELAVLDTDDVAQLAAVGRRIREAVTKYALPANLEADIRAAY